MNATRAALVVSVTLLAGCWSYRAGEPARLASVPVSTLPADAWPARSIEVVEQLSRLTPAAPAAVERASLQPGDGATTANDRARRVMKVSVTHNQVYGMGLLRVFRPLPGEGSWLSAYEGSQRDAVGFVPNARFITSRVLDDVRMQVERERRDRVARAAAELELAAIAKGGTVHIDERYDMSLLQFGMSVQLPGLSDRLPRGLIVHLHSIAPNPFEPRVIETFRRRGWAVVTLNTSTGIKAPFTPEQEEEFRALESKRTDLVVAHISSVTKQVMAWETGPVRPLKFPRPPGEKREMERLNKALEKLARGVRYHADTDADIEAVGRTVARETDEALASNAYAVEAVLDYLNAQRPDIAPRANHLPVVIVGMSAGALAAPAAAVRVRDQVNAVVLVGGGADLFRISQESSLTDGGIEVFRGKRRAPKPVRDAIDEAYLRTTRLDPYHTAPLLAGLPVLQVHAMWDGWVPQATGERLWQRLGRPDRIDFQGGHSTLFLFLPGRAGQIMDWIERATLGTNAADSPPSASGPPRTP